MSGSQNLLFETILLTGTAASGKSTLARKLASIKNFAAFEYGDDLYKRAAIRNPHITHSETRSHSEIYITEDDVRETDEALQVFIEENRNKYHVVIDSHAVSKEAYGFRSEPFRFGELKRANFSRIVCLYCEPNVIVKRTELDPEGRPSVTFSEATFYQNFQFTVAISYSTILGIPIHFINSEKGRDEVLDTFLMLIGSKSH